MVLSDGTPIKERLEREGRLRGDVCTPGYDFLDPRLDDCYLAIKSLVDVSGWIHGHGALSHQLNWIWNETGVLERLFPPLPDVESYKGELRDITRAANELLFDVVEAVADEHEHGVPSPWTPPMLQVRVEVFLSTLVAARNAFIARHQHVMLEALARAQSAPLVLPGATGDCAASDSLQSQAV